MMLSQLISAQAQAASKLDASILVYNTAVDSFLGGWAKVLTLVKCGGPTGYTIEKTSNTNWKDIAITIKSYSDIDKLIKNPNLSTNIVDYCSNTSSFYASSPEVGGDGNGNPAVNNLLNYSLIPFKKAYDDLIVKYNNYYSADKNLKEDPQYIGSIASQEAEGVAAGKTKNIKWLFFGLIAFIIVGAAVFMLFKMTNIPKKLIIGGGIGLLIANYLIFFGIGKK